MNYGTMVSIVTIPECASFARNVHATVKSAGHDVRKDIVLVSSEKFADGNSLVQIMESIRRTEVYFIYAMPLGQPEVGLTQFQLILNALQLASPVSIKVVLAYFEGRADQKDKPRIAINAKVLARAIEHEEKVDGFITFDLHSPQLVLAFNKLPVEELSGQVLLAAHARSFFDPTAKIGVISPDIGSDKRAHKFAKKSGYPFLGTIEKRRARANVVGSMRYIGDDIVGYDVIIPDDLGDTCGTVIKASECILERGAKSCTAYVTHWLGSPKSPEGKQNDVLHTAEAKLRKAGLKVVTTNTIPRTPEYIAANTDILTFVPCEEMLAKAIIKSLMPGESLSMLSE